jgi:beta-lactamase superfamily II metal-dependent hydrolase
MADKLLVRAYNVGCGDCIYVRIPGGNDGFHILIDCGKKGRDDLLKKALEHLSGELPKGKEKGTKRLDLIVATHRHEDHVKGFNADWFKNIEVKNIWLSAAMDPEHPQAKRVNELHSFANTTMRRLSESGQALSPDIELLAALYGVSNDQADELLMKTLPKANGIKPRYVHAGMTTSKDLHLDLPKGCAIHVLGPERDIDHFYLGEEVDTSLKGMQAISTAIAKTRDGAATPIAGDAAPGNIGLLDFRVLESRMLSNGLAFAAKDSSIQNNLSVVLLLEWGKRRLLFVGDAEWQGEFRDGKQNGSWNVIWEKYRNSHLAKPVDFLKIGHHGSINATPPPAGELRKSKKSEVSVYDILDTILPVPEKGAKPTAQAVVSTEREFYDPIPECKLLVNLGQRVSNDCAYGEGLKKKGIDPKKIWATDKAKKNKFFDKYEKNFLDEPQPLRTDLEYVMNGRNFVDVEIQ